MLGNIYIFEFEIKRIGMTCTGTHTGPFEKAGVPLPLPDTITGGLLLGMLFLADVISTEAILGLGGVELNPVMAGIVASPLLHGIVKAAVLLLVLSACRYAEKRVRYAGGLALMVLLLWYGVVIGNNVGVIAGMG